MLRILISGGNDVGSPEFSSLEIIRKHDSRGARFAADWEPLAFAFAGQPRRLSLHELYYQAGLPSLKRRVRVSPPFTTSRASVSSAPSCLILEPVTSIWSSALNTTPISSRNFLGQRNTWIAGSCPLFITR